MPRVIATSTASRQPPFRTIRGKDEVSNVPSVARVKLGDTKQSRCVCLFYALLYARVVGLLFPPANTTHCFVFVYQTVSVTMALHVENNNGTFKKTRNRSFDNTKMLRGMLREHALINVAPVKPSAISVMKRSLGVMFCTLACDSTLYIV